MAASFGVFGYSETYAPRCLEEQVQRLREFWPRLSPGGWITKLEKAEPRRSGGAEALFAFPRWELFASTYGESLDCHVLAALDESRRFRDKVEGRLGPKDLRQSERTVRFENRLRERQPSDILVVAAQFGKRWRTRQAIQVRGAFAESKTEFGLGAFAGGCMLLTHPERFSAPNDLWFGCLGDECRESYGPRKGTFTALPAFVYLDGVVQFEFDSEENFQPYRGSLSGFLED